MRAHPNPGDGPAISCDVLLLGAGLANSLLALELRRRRPSLRVVMVERRLGLDELHTWCIFRPDVRAEAWPIVKPHLDQSWSAYTVTFPEHTRRLTTDYGCLTGASLSRAVVASLGGAYIEGAEAREAGPEGARLADGRAISAPLVVDGRGWRSSPALHCGWQKFVGLDCRLDRAHGLAWPTVMDASVEQVDGYRFLYVLPLGPDRLLIEDTRYSDVPHVDRGELNAAIRGYAAARNWRIAEVLRQEEGVLPVVLGGDLAAFLAEQGSLPAVGMRGGFFHPTTGYSLPRAVETAALIASAPRLVSHEIASTLQRRAAADWQASGFYRLLNRMLFQAAVPRERYRILQRFYRLPLPVIERFYAGRSTLADKARILLGRPPVPVVAAIRAMRHRRPAVAHA